MMTRESFKERLKAAIKERGNRLCVGIDPPLAPEAGFLKQELQRMGGAPFLERYANGLVDAATNRAPAVKFQSAFFEAYGSEGFEVLRKACIRARDKGLFTILDAKRGDISTTMGAYGRMAFDVMKADALTVTPYMGFDVVEPLRAWLASGRGVYVVWISSNPGGAFLQDLRVGDDGSTMAEVLLAHFTQRFEELHLKDAFGLVLGATKIESLSLGLASRLSGIPLLMPGVGAQGGKVSPALRNIMSASEAALVPLSRGLSHPTTDGGSEVRTWDEYLALVSARVTQEAATLA